MSAHPPIIAAHKYVGNELELFASATIWKSYVRANLQPYLGDSVMEVGAGIGGTTRVLCSGREKKWLCVEADPELAGQIRSAIAARKLPQCCEVLCGTLGSRAASSRSGDSAATEPSTAGHRPKAAPQRSKDGPGSCRHKPAPPATLAREPLFDTVVYIDVLEHIEKDAAELRLAAEFLAPEGHLIVLGPAHQWLFTPFDEAIGHFRRYSKKSLAAVAPPLCRCIKLAYLDSVGLLASCGNRVVLNRSMPTVRQINFWDKWMVPCSRVLDGLLGHTVGKSILGVWQKGKELANEGKKRP